MNQYSWPSDNARFMAKVKKQKNGCWIWTACSFKNGYGQIYYKGKKVKAHRLSWMLHKGPIPLNIGVLHRCDVPACVRPAHLFLGTHSENMQDARLKDRFRKGETHPAAKLTKKAVKNMRGLHRLMTHSGLSDKFGVSLSTVNRVLNSKNWKHVAGNTPSRPNSLAARTKCAKNMLGFVSGSLHVISRHAISSKDRHAKWKCKCACGKTKVVLGKHMRSGATKSCGCGARKGLGQK